MTRFWWARRRLGLVGPTALAVGAIVACGSGFTVKRVHSDDQTTEGIRFYRPWPNLVVTKEFPIATSACFVNATLTANGQYLVMDADTLKLLDGAAVPVAAAGGGVAQLPVTALGAGGALQAGNKSIKSASDAGAEGGTTPASSADAGTNVSITSGTGTQPIALSDSLSVLYLPDSTENYAIQFSGSTQDAKLTLTSGWMLEGLNVQSQNVVANLIQNVVTTVLPSLEKLIPGLQAGTTTLTNAAKNATAPQPVVIKVHVVQYAVPGVYPMGKGAYNPTATSKTPVACDAKAGLPSVVDVGIFKVQTRAEVLLEVQSVGGTSSSSSANGGAATPSDGDDTSCLSGVQSQFAAWAGGHSGGVAVTPQVLSVSGGKLVIGITFGASVTAAQKATALNALKVLPASVVSSNVCSFNQSAITVCDQAQATTCKASP
jgi:hypothetical protein